MARQMDQEQIVHKFRSSLGGFNRQDVMAYITQTDAAYRKRLETMEKELSALRTRGEEQDAAIENLRGENEDLSAEAAKVRASLEESTRSLTKLRGELSQAETKLAVAKSELTRLKERLGELEPQARNYEELKERVAVIELDAHRRAQEIVDEGQLQADTLRRDGRQWLSGLLGQYDQLRQSVDGLSGQLQSLGELSNALREGDEAAAKLREWEGEDHE